MADGTKIEWADASLNPIRAIHRTTGKIGWHCTHVSEGCRQCYAEGMNRRLGTGLPYKPGYEMDVGIYVDTEQLEKLLRWRRPRRVFLGSMTDIAGEFVTEEMFAEVLAWCAAAYWHDILLLTKRPARLRDLLSRTDVREMAEAHMSSIDTMAGAIGLYDPLARRSDDWRAKVPCLTDAAAWPLPNLWIGTSVEDQASASERIPYLIATPAVVRWVSAEPLLGPVFPWLPSIAAATWKLTAPDFVRPGVDWIVAGGESGPNARPCHPDWLRSLRDQSAAAGVPFFFKQWGEWAPAVGFREILRFRGRPWVNVSADGAVDSAPSGCGLSPGDVFLLGKKRAGRLLDDREHQDFPAGRRINDEGKVRA